MSFTFLPDTIIGMKQRLENLGPGALVPASEVKVYKMVNGKKVLLKTLDKDGNPIK